MKVFKILISVIVALALIGGIVWNHRINQTVHVSFYQLSTNKNITGLRILALSDLHLAEFGPENGELVRKVEGLHPDLIAVVGDMTIETVPDHSVVIRLVEQLTKIAPVYYSAGNNEYTDILYNKNSTLIKDITQAGAVFVDDRIIEVEVGNNRLLLGGVCKNADDVLKYSGSRTTVEKLSQEKSFTVLLSHYPEIFISAMEGYPVDLALAGHTHGGHVRLPFTDGIYTPDQGFFPKYASGMRELCGSTVIISRGLGNHGWVPRVNNPPEIVVVDIN